METSVLLGYIAKFKDGAHEGPASQLYYEDTDEGRKRAEEYARRIDESGYSVYSCIGRLRCRPRSKENVAELPCIVLDNDLRAVVQTREQVLECLRNLPIPPSWIRDSGGGIHSGWELKEPLTDEAGMARAEEVMRRLANLLAADPAPTHRAALLRYPGTHNTRYGESRECRVIESTGVPCDISEFADLFDLYGDTQLLHYKEKPGTKGNGSDKDAGAPFRTSTGHLDIDAALAGMEPNGGSVNDIQPRVILSLLQKAVHPDDVIAWVVDETMKMADAAGLGWSRELEVKCVLERCKCDVSKLNREYDPSSGTVPPWLAGDFHPEWVDALAAGRRPKLFHSSHIGWHVRTFGAKSEKAQAAAEASAPPEARAANRVLVLRPFVPFDPAMLPPRAWLYARHYQRRTVSLTAGPGGMGKSSLVLVECVAMATGRNLLGEQPTERLRIWLHNGEDPLEEIHRRLAAICQHYKIPQEELLGQLWITSGNEFPLRVAKGYANLEINAGLVRQISSAIGDNQIDVAAFDPLVTLHSVSEGDPGKMDAVVRLFAGIADEHDASVELNHHVRKPPPGTDSDHDVFDIRGVMAITDAVRAARVLNRMNKADAENAGISEIDRLSHFRVDKAKGNYSPAQAATWRRFVNVDLPNTDSVGVVEPWDFPGQGTATPEKAAADQRAEKVFLQLLDKFLVRGVNVSASVGPNFAPAKFAGEQEANGREGVESSTQGRHDPTARCRSG
jgi:RecA-family ATPase